MKLFVGAKAIIHHNGKILLLRESTVYVDGTEAGKWDVPGGRIEPEEKVRDGLVREVKEECGLEVEPRELLGVFDGFPRIGDMDCHVVRIYFLCKAETDDVLLSKDHDAYDWVLPGTIKDKVLMNDIDELIQKANELI